MIRWPLAAIQTRGDVGAVLGFVSLQPRERLLPHRCLRCATAPQDFCRRIQSGNNYDINNDDSDNDDDDDTSNDNDNDNDNDNNYDNDNDHDNDNDNDDG